MLKKILIIIMILSIILSIIIFFIKKDYKSFNLGNNISIKNLKDNIEHMSSYEATVTVTIESNKNINTYKLNQKYVKPNLCETEVLEPANIKGLITSYNGKELKLENTNLNLTKIYKEYPYIAGHKLMLNTFVEEYLNEETSNYSEEGIFITKNKKLYVDKKTGEPIKMEINDVNNNTKIYILYNEININGVLESDMFL